MKFVAATGANARLAFDKFPLNFSTGGSGSSTPGVDWLFYEDFSNPLDLTAPGYDGKWMSTWGWMHDGGNDWTGYQDFAGSDTWIIGTGNPAEVSEHNPFVVDEGILTINCIRMPEDLETYLEIELGEGNAPGWASGLLFTDWRQFECLYGFIEFRVRAPNTPTGKGQWPGWWMYAIYGSIDPNDKGGAEIDLAEIFGHSDGSPLQTTLHFRDNANEEVRSPMTVATIETPTDEWYTHSLDWQPTYLRFYINDIMYAEVTGEWAEWFDTPMQLIIGMAADGNWFAGAGYEVSDGSTPNPLRTQADYIRVRETKAAYTTAPDTAPVISVNGGDGEFTISMVFADLVERAETYHLEKSDNGTTGWTTVTDSFWTEYVDDGYGDGVTKYYRCTASNSVGDSDPSAVESDTTNAVVGELIPADWASNVASWHGGNIPANWSMTAGKIVTTDGNWSSDNIILTSSATALVPYQFTMNVVLGSGGGNVNFNGSGNEPTAHELTNGLNSFQLTLPEFAAPWVQIIVQSVGFELTSFSVVPA